MNDGFGDAPEGDASKTGTSRLRVLQALRQAPSGLGVQELTEQVGLHANTVRFHLERLVTAGVVIRHTEERTQPGRPRLTFTLVPGRTAHGDKRSYRLLAEILASYFAGAVSNPAREATEAGRTWGQYLPERPGPYRRTSDEASLAELLRILDDIGFAPELAQKKERREIWMRHCPFLEVATEHRDVVCSVHLGLMQGVLAEMRAPITTGWLEPLVEPSLCVAGLTRGRGGANRRHRTPSP